MSLVYKRMYVDIPASTHGKLVIEAARCGMAQKVLVAELIEERCNPKPKRRSKKKAKRKPARSKR